MEKKKKKTINIVRDTFKQLITLYSTVNQSLMTVFLRIGTDTIINMCAIYCNNYRIELAYKTCRTLLRYSFTPYNAKYIKSLVWTKNS